MEDPREGLKARSIVCQTPGSCSRPSCAVEAMNRSAPSLAVLVQCSEELVPGDAFLAVGFLQCFFELGLKRRGQAHHRFRALCEDDENADGNFHIAIVLPRTTERQRRDLGQPGATPQVRESDLWEGLKARSIRGHTWLVL